MTTRNAYRCPAGHERATYTVNDGMPESDPLPAEFPCNHFDQTGQRCPGSAVIAESRVVTENYSGVHQRFLDLQPDPGRTEMTVGKQVVVLIYEGNNLDEARRRLPGLIEAPHGLDEMIVAVFTGRI